MHVAGPDWPGPRRSRRRAHKHTVIVRCKLFLQEQAQHDFPFLPIGPVRVIILLESLAWEVLQCETLVVIALTIRPDQMDGIIGLASAMLLSE